MDSEDDKRESDGSGGSEKGINGQNKVKTTRVLRAPIERECIGKASRLGKDRRKKQEGDKG